MSGLSFDQNRVEDLKRVSAFFDFISNPQAYQAFVVEAREILAKMEKVVGAYTTVEKAGEYLAQVQAKIGETNAYVDAEQAKLAERIAEADRGLSARRSLLDKREDRVQKREVSLANDDAARLAAEAALATRADELRAAETYVANAKAQVERQQAELAGRAAKLREIAGA